MIDRADPPRAKDQPQQIDRARQHARHHIAGPHPLIMQQIGDLCREIAQLFECIAAQPLIGVKAAQRQPVFTAMAVAALDAGIDRGVEITGKTRGLGGEIECGHGIAMPLTGHLLRLRFHLLSSQSCMRGHGWQQVPSLGRILLQLV